MQDGVDWYLSSHPTVFPIERKNSCIVLKTQKSYRSDGELITVSVRENSFGIVSKCHEESPQLVAWGKNRENVIFLSACLKSQMRELLCVATRSGLTT